jgi:hypothetical protein
MTDHPSFLVLAIEARRTRFGYALFEGPKQLLDWGASEIPSGLSDRDAIVFARRQLARVLRRGSPIAIVVARPRRKQNRSTVSDGPMLRSILQEAETWKIPVCCLEREEIRTALCHFRAQSKEQLACVLVSAFPAITHRLPQKRKKWQPERRGMIVFEAIAAGLAYWLQLRPKVTPHR